MPKYSPTEILRLRGKELNCHDGRKLYVAHVDREIGITIKDQKTDKDAYCLSLEQWKSECSSRFCDWRRDYHRFFSLLLDNIENNTGKYRVVFRPSTQTCFIMSEYISSRTLSFTCPWSH